MEEMRRFFCKMVKENQEYAHSHHLKNYMKIRFKAEAPQIGQFKTTNETKVQVFGCKAQK